MRQTLLFLLLLLPLALSAYTGVVTLDHSQLTTGGLHSISLPASPGLLQVLRSAKLYARLDLGDDYDLGANAWNANVALQVKGYSGANNSSPLLFTESVLMSANQGEPEVFWEKDIASVWPSIGYLELNVQSYTCSTAVAQARIRLRAGYETSEGTRARPLSGGGNAATITLSNPTLPNVSTGASYTTFSWTSTYSSLVPGYELQILRLYNNDTVNLTESAIDAEVDWSQAMSYLTERGVTNARITLSEGQGYYAWRVRAIGDYYPGGHADARNWGDWSSSSPSNGSQTITAASLPALFFYDQVEIDKNWSHGRVFTEGGRIKEQMTYANGLLYGKQSQVHLPSEGNSVLSQTEYDFAGRAAFSALPAPTGQDYLRFVPEALQHSGQPYTAENFDDNGNWYNPDVLDGGVVADYYDGQNTTGGPIPDAGGYGFSRSLFYGDGASRVMEQAGPGPSHRLGASGTPRTQRTFYASVTDEELVRVFGDEAPSFKDVMKTVQIDPNGTATVSYVDKSGSVIATCLSGSADGDELLAPLPSASSAPFEVEHRLENFEVRGNVIWSGATFALASTTTITVDHQMNLGEIEDACTELCQTCDYRVYLRLSRLDRPEACPQCGVLSGSEQTVGGGACPGGALPAFTPITVSNLAPGQYVLERIAEPYQAAPGSGTVLDAFLQEVRDGILTETGTALDALRDFITAGDLEGLNAHLETLCPGIEEGEFCTVTTECCTLQVPYNTCAPQDCGTIDWEAMLVDRWEPTYSSNGDFADYIPAGAQYANGSYGFATPGTFNTLVDKMLAGEGLGSPYTCEELHNCWFTLVETWEAMTSLDPDYDIVDAFMMCVGYRLQTYTTTANGTGGSLGWASHPYGAFNYTSGQHTYCEAALCGGVSFATCFTAMTEAERQNFLLCTRQMSGTAGSSGLITSTVEDVEEACQAACADRFYAFEQMVRDYYHGLGKFIEDEPGAVGQSGSLVMPVSDVYCKAQMMVEACKGNCAFEVVLDGGDPVSVDPEEGKDPECWLTGYIELLGEPTGLGGTCTTGVALGTPGDLLGRQLVRYLNRKSEEERPSLALNGNNWDVSPYGAMMDGSSCFSSTVNVFLHPAEKYYFSAPETDNMGDIDCDLLFTREGVLVPNANFSDPDGDYHEVVLSFPYVAGPTTFYYPFPGTFTIAPAVVVSSANATVAGTPTVNGCSLTVAGGFNGTIVLTVTGGNSTQTVCTDMCEDAVGCEPVCVQCTQPEPSHPFEEIPPVSCEERQLDYLAGLLDQQVGQCIDSRLAGLKEQYRKNCIDGYSDEVTVRYEVAYHHYMLYYYDRAGNLVRTTPPHGVDISAADRQDHPAHQFETRYVHNSLKQLVRQKTPDGGETEFWYDKIGRMRFSQNAQQALDGNYSYTKYDNLGRVIEVGQSAEDEGSLGSHVDVQTFPSVTGQVTYTVYTKPAAIVNLAGQAQRYLENNVSHTYTSEGLYTFFSYDPHGNVDWMVQRIPGLGDKQIAYEYDLVSGKVLKVKYQEGRADQWFHRYTYDEDNRLTVAETSRDGIVWDRDGRYDYYTHGPLERLLVGEDEVQGLDYVHTLQGWLKAVNHSSLEPTQDPGGDGWMSGAVPVGNTGRDAWGMQLSYHQGDFSHGVSTQYDSDGSNMWHLDPGTVFGYDGLYNGNISAWTWRWDDHQLGGAIPGVQQQAARGNAYRYDELNRLVGVRWGVHDGSSGYDLSSGEYAEDYAYDPAGNIRALDRKAYDISSSVAMDSLGYWYNTENDSTVFWRYDVGSGLYKLSNDPTPRTLAYINATLGLRLQNRLDHVTDLDGVAYSSDLGTQGNRNYRYNEIGELTRDATEGLGVDWTAYHKVSNVHFAGAAANTPEDISFLYDPMQRRAVKRVDNSATLDDLVTYYIHDAQGNVMAIYERTYDNGIFNTRLKELPIYGGDRLGLRLDDTKVKLEALCVYCGDVTGLQPGMLRVAELLYDSPTSDPTDPVETHVGEYVTVRNVSDIPIPMGQVKVRVPGNGTYSFNVADTLAPGQGTIIAYGTAGDSADLRLAGNLPSGLFNDPEVVWRWQTGMVMPDGGGSLQLYEEVGMVETVLEDVDFGSGGVEADNATCDAVCQTSPGRDAVLAVVLDDYGDVYSYVGEPYAAREASGKGKGGDVFYVPKASVGRRLARKDYELKDHLGNVRVVVSDVKHSTISSGVVGDFNADVRVLRDYYAFGMEMPGQVWEAGGYRYGFNGMERDDELKGRGNSYDFGARMFDPRVGRFLSIDPLFGRFLHVSPYVFVLNSPIVLVDPSGMAPEGGEHWKDNARKVANLYGVKIDEHSANKWSVDVIHRGKTYGLLFTPGGSFDRPLWEEEVVDNRGIDVRFREYLEQKFDKRESDFGLSSDHPMSVVAQEGGAVLYHMVPTSWAVYLATGSEGPQTKTAVGDVLSFGADFISPGGGKINSFKKALTYSDNILGVADDAAKAVIKSKVKEDSRLLKFARDTFEGNKRLRNEVNSVIAQMKKGNMNPGIDTRSIGAGLFESRTASGGRVYFRNAENQVQIVGYSNKGNQDKVIGHLKELYGK